MIGKWLHSHLDDPVELGVVAALVGGERLRPQHRLGEVALVRPAAAAEAATAAEGDDMPADVAVAALEDDDDFALVNSA